MTISIDDDPRIDTVLIRHPPEKPGEEELYEIVTKGVRPPSCHIQIEDKTMINMNHNKTSDDIYGYYTEKGILCKYCTKPFGSIPWLKHHWGFSCTKLDEMMKEHFVKKYKLVKRFKKRKEQKADKQSISKDIEILKEKLPDRSEEILSNIEVLKKALTAKAMNPEKIQVLTNWINTERLKQL